MPALVALGTAPGGSSRLTVRLDPAELGQVQIQIDRAHDATAAVRITAERPETLSLLMRDQHDLRRTLDQAGVPTDGRTLSFQLADQPPPSSNGSSNGGEGQGFAGGAGNDPGQSRGGRNTPWQSGGEARETMAARSTRSWARSGLDITA